MKKPRALIYSQSLLGLGHVVRGLALADALSIGFEICLLLGTTPELSLVPKRSYRIVQLEPLRLNLDRRLNHPLEIEDDWTSFLGSCNTPVSSMVIERRRVAIQSEFDKFRPDVIITEYFPLARYAFRSELLEPLEFARNNGARIVCSVRDIILPVDEESPWKSALGNRYEEGFWAYYDRAIRLLNERFDLLLVHSDERILKLEDSVLGANKITIPISYTGYLSTSLQLNSGKREGEHTPFCEQPVAVISAGGGHGEVQFLLDWIPALAVLMHEGTLGPGLTDVFCGPLMSKESYLQVCEKAGSYSGFRVSRFSNEFQNRMASARLSVSRAGYNTATNILNSETPALLLPAKHLVDQKLRSRRFGECKIAAGFEGPLTLERQITELLRTVEMGNGNRDFNKEGARFTYEAINSLV